VIDTTFLIKEGDFEDSPEANGQFMPDLIRAWIS